MLIFRILWYIIEQSSESTISFYNVCIILNNKCPHCKNKTLHVQKNSFWDDTHCYSCGYSFMKYYHTQIRYDYTGTYTSNIDEGTLRVNKIKRLIKRGKPWYKRIF